MNKTMLGYKDLLFDIRRSAKRTCYIRLEKTDEIGFQVRLKNPYLVAVTLLSRIAPIGLLEILRRCDRIRYVSSSFHAVS